MSTSIEEPRSGAVIIQNTPNDSILNCQQYNLRLAESFVQKSCLPNLFKRNFLLF